jgi:protein-tyrosine-phosphatase
MTRRVLIVCHANTSRSKMAEALLRRMLRERAREDIIVESGGIAAYARDGALVSMDARLVLRDEGIHFSPDAVATDLKTNRHLITSAVVILAMTRDQVDMLRADFAEAAGKKILTLKQLAGSDGDIHDPAGQDEQVFAARRDEIKLCLTRGLERLLAL